MSISFKKELVGMESTDDQEQFDEMVETENAPVSRSQFSKAMTARLIDIITENYRLLYPTSDVAEGRRLSNASWKAVTAQLNAEFPDNKKTVVQVMAKWNNYKKDTKKKVHIGNR
jgi:hypothetical protein